MADTPRLSNAHDYEITAGRLCPKCGNQAQTLIEAIRVGFLCNVCSHTWRGVPEKYR